MSLLAMGDIRIGIMSDLHLEHEWRREFVGDVDWYALRDVRRASLGHPDLGPYLGDLFGNVDLVVVAGDTAPGTAGIGYLSAVREYLGIPVVALAGNHEFYGHVVDDLRNELCTMADDAGLIWLDDSAARLEIGGRPVVITGGTLWTDFRAGEPFVTREMAMRNAAKLMNDFSEVFLSSNSTLRPEDTVGLWQATRSHIEDAVVASGARPPWATGLPWPKLVTMCWTSPMRRTRGSRTRTPRCWRRHGPRWKTVPTTAAHR